MIDQMQETITELREMLNEAHALNRRQAARIEEMDSRVSAYQAEIAQLGRIQSAHLSELDDYGRTTAKLNRRVMELRGILIKSISAVGGYASEGASDDFLGHLPDEITGKLAALAKGVTRG